MKLKLLLSLLISSSYAIADPTVFGMKLGKTTESELKVAYNVNHVGTNKYSNGNMYSIPTQSISFNGLQEVTAIFDKDNILVAVLTTLPKSKFDYLNEALSGKYNVTSRKIPFVGDKQVKYRDGKTEIILDAPHMSFKMTMHYIRDDLMQAFNKQTESEKRAKQSSESAQL